MCTNVGNATRECAVNGEWLDPNVTDCLGVEFVEAQRVCMWGGGLLGEY